MDAELIDIDPWAVAQLKSPRLLAGSVLNGS